MSKKTKAAKQKLANQLRERMKCFLGIDKTDREIWIEYTQGTAEMQTWWKHHDEYLKDKCKEQLAKNFLRDIGESLFNREINNS